MPPSLGNLRDGHSSPLKHTQWKLMLLIRKLLLMFYLNMPMCCLWPLLFADWLGEKSCNVHTLWWMIFYSLWCVNCQRRAFVLRQDRCFAELNTNSSSNILHQKCGKIWIRSPDIQTDWLAVDFFTICPVGPSDISDVSCK